MSYPIEFVGIDVAKDDFCVFMSHEQIHFTISNTAEGHQRLIKRFAGRRDILIALEPTGGCEWALWEALEIAGFDVRQVSAAHVRSFARSLGNMAKTDPLDAEMIARFIAFRPDAGRSLPAEKIRKLNVLTTKRRQLVCIRKTLSCQIKQRASQVLDDLDDAHMTLLKEQITILEKQMQSLLQKDENLNRRSEILRSVPGIGPILTAALIGQMPELGHLNNKQVAALTGLAPINHDSGKYIGKRQIKGGRTWLRHLLYQAALSASRHNPVLSAFAQKLKEKGKPHKLVIIAVARRLIVIANTLIAKNTLWKPV